MTPNNSYSCRCSKLSHLVPPFIISEKGCKKKVICSEIVLEFKCALQLCPRCVLHCFAPPVPKTLSMFWHRLPLNSLQRHAHTRTHIHICCTLWRAQRSSCHSNTKLSESPPKHRHGVFYLKKKKTRRRQDGLRSWINGGSHTATVS